MIAWLDAFAAARPEAPALAWREADNRLVRLSAAALHERSLRVGAALQARGVRRGDLVALRLPPGEPFVSALHAIWGIGAAAAPLNLRLPAAEAERQLARLAPRLVVDAPLIAPLDAGAPDAEAPGSADAPAPSTAPGGSDSVVAHVTSDSTTASDSVVAHVTSITSAASAEFDSVVPHAASDAPAAYATPGASTTPITPREIDPQQTALILFTSGTGGAPKAACLRFANLAASAHASRLHLASNAEDCWLACLPFHHVGGLSILVRAALDGSSVFLQSGFDVHAVSRAIDEEGVTRVSLVPTTLKRLLDARADRPPPARLRSVLLGGAPASPALLGRARSAGFPVQATYGLTETASQVATARVDASLEDAGLLPPLPGVCLRIVDADGAVLPPGREGEIQVRGPVVFAGYAGDAEATAAAFDGAWLCSGDIGMLDAAGRLRVLDRRSDLIVSGGENVYPAEVEAVLLEHTDVDEAGVWGVAHDDLGRRVTAWVVLRAGAEPNPDALTAHCRLRLAGYQIPREFFFVDALPRTAMGKLQRRKLGT